MKFKVYHFEYEKRGSYLLVAANNIDRALKLARNLVEKEGYSEEPCYKGSTGMIYETSNPEHVDGLIIIDRYYAF